MRLRLALACLTAAIALPACFNPMLSCRLTCSTQSDCPAGLTCQASTQYGGLCAQSGDICEPQDASAGRETGPAPTQRCTKDGAHCIVLSDAVRNGLVLWLDPTNLPPPNSRVQVWRDQSGQGNDAYPPPVDSDAPIAGSSGVSFVPGAFGAGLQVSPQPSLDFGTDDFLILAVARVATEGTGGIFTKVGTDRCAQQVLLEWLPSSSPNSYVPTGFVNDTSVAPTSVVSLGTSPGLFGLRRNANQLEIRLSGASLATVAISSPETSTNNSSPVFLGVFGSTGAPIVGLNAVVVVRGTISDEDLASLESLLSFVALEGS